MSEPEQSLTEKVPDTTLSLSNALSQLRDGVETRSDENSVLHDVLALAASLDVPTEAFGHPKITQTIWRYEHPAETVREEIKRAFETYDLDGEPEAVVEVLKLMAERQVTTDGQESSEAGASA